MRYFMDTHDTANGTFPAGLTPEQLKEFVAGYAKACQEEGVEILRVHVNLEAGRAFCFTAAPDADAVARAHERVGLPFDGITEVSTITPADFFLASA